MKKISLASFTVSLLAGVGFAFFAMNATAASTPGTILIGTDTTFPPFESEDNGKMVGFDIDMINGIAKAEGLKLEIKTMPFNGIIPSLQSGQLDAAVAGISITKARMKNIDYTDAYYKSGLSILVKSDSDIKNFNGLKGHVVAAKKGTSSVDYLSQHGFDMSHVKQFAQTGSLYQALMSGSADAVLFDNPMNLYFKSQHPGDVKRVGKLLTGEYYGIAVSKKHPELVAKFNDGLAKIKKNGLYKKLFAKWFGGDMSSAVLDVKKPGDVAAGD